ncbi:hypothetical protein AMJ87_02420 [candidate division WOR_3 bacterium SM23_60]|uniref:Uncharacterized protein n=1 Tax=candidate division WOR_3 bacterium SM23_60 TaxID=1703780 RepID=A0A0S8GNL8_UNCW3|nr:MAG: hypothetical protein AMJ87_02420 [candidate division WOR_3 bacterium SM23_60]
MKGIVVVVIFVLAGILYASAGNDSLGITNVPGQKSEVVAVGLSLVTTVVPITAGFFVESEENDVGFWTLIAPGIIVGPSVGHSYANQWGRGLTTAGLRLGILGAGIIGLNLAVSEDDDISGRFGDALYVAAATILALSVHALYDIAVAQESARKYNESLKASGKALIIPRVDPKNKSCGVSLVYYF